MCGEVDACSEDVHRCESGFANSTGMCAFDRSYVGVVWCVDCSGKLGCEARQNKSKAKQVHGAKDK